MMKMNLLCEYMATVYLMEISNDGNYGFSSQRILPFNGIILKWIYLDSKRKNMKLLLFNIQKSFIQTILKNWFKESKNGWLDPIQTPLYS